MLLCADLFVDVVSIWHPAAAVILKIGSVYMLNIQLVYLSQEKILAFIYVANYYFD